MSNVVSEILTSAYEPTVAKELIAAHEEAKRNFYLSGHRLSAVEGGRFCEAAYRMLQHRTTGSFTPLGAQLDTIKLAKQLESLPREHPSSIRIYMPRALRVVYDIRNNRDAAHLADGVSANLQDATLVVSILDWVMAEFVRLSKAIDPDEAQRLIDSLVSRSVPVIQKFGTFPKVLRTDLRASEFILVLLCYSAPHGATFADLRDWVPEQMSANLRRTLNTLADKAYVHLDGERAHITFSGQRFVDKRKLLGPDDIMFG